MPDLIRTVLIYSCLSQCPIFSASSITRRCMQPASTLRQGHWFTSVGSLHWRAKRRMQLKWEVWSPLTQLRKHILTVINGAAHTSAGVPGWLVGACTFIKVAHSGLLPPRFPCDLEKPPGLGSRGDFSSTLSEACMARSCCEWVFCQWCQITRGSFLRSDLLLLLIGDRAETIQLIFLRTASWSGGSPSSESLAHAFLTQQLYSMELKKMSTRSYLMDRSQHFKDEIWGSLACGCKRAGKKKTKKRKQVCRRLLARLAMPLFLPVKGKRETFALKNTEK